MPKEAAVLFNPTPTPYDTVEKMENMRQAEVRSKYEWQKLRLNPKTIAAFDKLISLMRRDIEGIQRELDRKR